VCFSEALACLSAKHYLPLAGASAPALHFAGAQSKQAAQFCAFGGGAPLDPRVPVNCSAEALLGKPHARGIETRSVLRGGALAFTSKSLDLARVLA
jgi:hypothetical protein